MSRAVPLILDALLVIVFAAIGRRSHAEGLDLIGIARTAAPFLAGAAIGWVIATLALSAEPRSLAFGAVVVASAVVVGMLIRVLTGAGTAFSFIIVATISLSVLLLGWRLIARFLPA